MAKPIFKLLTWSLKFESDMIKVPDFKATLPIAGSYELEAVAGNADRATGNAVVTPIPLTDVPGTLPIILLVIKVAAASIKDLIKPLRVRLNKTGGTAADHTEWREMNAEIAKSGMLYAKFLIDPMQTREKDWALEVENPNASDLGIQIQVAFGTSP